MTSEPMTRPVWAPFVYLSEYRVKKDSRTKHAWVAERLPITLDPAPRRQPAIVLRGRGREIIWSTDGERLYRKALNTDGEPLRIEDLEWADLDARQLLGGPDSHSTLVDYPLTVQDRRNESEALTSVEWRADIEGSTPKCSRFQFAKWEKDGRASGLARVALAMKSMWLDEGVLIRAADEPLIAVQVFGDQPEVILHVVVPPDLHDNAVMFSTLVDTEELEGAARFHARSTDKGQLVYFRIDEAEAARRCADKLASDREGGYVIDLTPEIELTGEWTPKGDDGRALLEAFLTRVRWSNWDYGRRQSPAPYTPAMVMARRALTLAERGDHRLLPLAVEAIADDADEKSANASIRGFAALQAAAREAREETAETDPELAGLRL